MHSIRQSPLCLKIHVVIGKNIWEFHLNGTWLSKIAGFFSFSSNNFNCSRIYIRTVTLTIKWYLWVYDILSKYFVSLISLYIYLFSILKKWMESVHEYKENDSDESNIFTIYHFHPANKKCLYFFCFCYSVRKNVLHKIMNHFKIIRLRDHGRFSIMQKNILI